MAARDNQSNGLEDDPQLGGKCADDLICLSGGVFGG